jgi:hypothetical protein
LEKGKVVDSLECGGLTPLWIAKAWFRSERALVFETESGVQPPHSEIELQCEWGLPVPHNPQDLGLPVHTGPSSAPPEDANTENFFSSFFDPQCGQAVAFDLLERTSTSLSFPHFSQ